MSKIAVVFWSGTGNTKAMAEAVLAGAKDAGAEADLFEAAEFDNGKAAAYDALAFGCPAMGAEELEDSEFEPMFADVESALAGKKVALFGSYGWGDGQWMRDWQDRLKAGGATIVGGEGVTCNSAPGDDAISQCEDLGRQLAQA